ncbi:hypothetical protein ACHQM5_023611 [Ranunculus cassubicifolius]
MEASLKMMKPETLTLILVNLAGIMQRADESLLPGVYKEVGETLHVGPTSLGSLTLFRSIVQTFCYPLAAYLSVYHNRAHVIALGAFLWAAATFFVGISTTFFQVAVSRGLNGIGLAIVIPAIQSLVADSTDDNNRGMAFGWLQLTGNLGSILGGLMSVLIASTSFMGIPGWRISFHLVAILSVIIGVLVRLYANDPNYAEGGSKSGNKNHRKSLISEVKDVIQEAKTVIKISSFQIIVAQGVFGTFPWSALSFSAMWLELIGFSHKQTAFLLSMYTISNSLGGLFGGKMGDILSQPFPNSGRIVMSQLSSGSAIPIAAVLMLFLPDDPSAAFLYGLLFFILGLFTSWNAPATNNPIFAEIVPEKSRTSIYALDQSFESILSSFAPPAVGLLAQKCYGFKPVPHGSSGNIQIATDRENAASLAKALYTAMAIPMTICCIIYSFLYCTYPRDRDRARMEAFIEAEMKNIEFDNPPQVGISKADQSYHEASTIDIDNEEEVGVQVDESDEKKLLSHQLTSSNPGE